MKKLAIILTALLTAVFFAACNKPAPTPPGPEPDPEPTPTYGLPVAEEGYYIKDAEVFDDGATRYAIYTTNGESAEEYNVFAVRSATHDGTGWIYGEESIILEAEAGAWNEYLGSASVVKGAFEYGDVNYSYLMAYSATDNTNETDNEIGLAVATSVAGPWVQVGTTSFLAYDEAVYGPYVGLYAPSLVNLNGQSIVRIYYTYADAYGHFSKFVDINAADLDALLSADAATDVTLISGSVHMPQGGSFTWGDGMFPNADFAHDATNGKVYTVKDISPAAATRPSFAERLEFGYIAEAELYTIGGAGWQTMKVLDQFDTMDVNDPEDLGFERLYSACIVTDAYGHVDGAVDFEIIYNVCKTAADTDDYLFTQNLMSYEYAPVVVE